MRLIDADALREFVEGRYTITWNHDYDGGIKDACIDILNFIDTAPTIDAVPRADYEELERHFVNWEPVVRCKDCRYYQDNNGGYPNADCKWCMDETPDADDYCSCGERKDDE